VNPGSPTTVPIAPLWTLDGLRAADPVLGLALLVLLAVVVAEALHRAWSLPRACGHMLTGAIASPVLLRLLDRAELDAWKPLIDLAIGALVFELGARIRPRWLLDNGALATAALLQPLLCGASVAAALVLWGAPLLSAAVAGSVAMAASPLIALTATHELRARGQVTERLLLMAALGSVMAALTLKALRIVLAGDAAAGNEAWLVALAGGLRVVGGSLLLGAAVGLLLERLSPLVRGTPAMTVLQLAVVITASMLAAQWTLSPLLALLVAGMVARSRLGHLLTVEPQLGSAGAALTVLLFVSLGLLFTLEGLAQHWPWMLGIVGARLLATAAVMAATARWSGLSMRQAAGLTLALQPMSSLAVLLAAENYAWAAQLPGIDAGVLQALLLSITLMQLTGPAWVRLALHGVTREATDD
jgi:Kef-type K+ transport system membrane component KefB